MTREMMRENELLARIADAGARQGSRFPGVLVGPGDDCAVVDAGGTHALLKVDQLIVGRHVREDCPAPLVARKALARPLSDIAAMGGTPVGALVAAAFPAGTDQRLADALCDALFDAAGELGCPLVGGDVAIQPDRPGATLVLSVTCVGTCHRERGPVLRRGGRAGDGAYVTGAIGGSFDSTTGAGRHLTFTPRLREAAALCDALGQRLHAMIDVSDGLGIDAWRVARSSGVCIELDGAAVPLAPGVTDPARACGDGEDYELFFCASGPVPASVPGPRGQTPVTRIGRVVAGEGAALILRDGSRVDASRLGYEHRT